MHIIIDKKLHISGKLIQIYKNYLKYYNYHRKKKKHVKQTFSKFTNNCFFQKEILLAHLNSL